LPELDHCEPIAWQRALAFLLERHIHAPVKAYLPVRSRSSTNANTSTKDEITARICPRIRSRLARFLENQSLAWNTKLTGERAARAT